MISIHALREEGDSRSCCNKRSIPDFYPRPPRGGRRASLVALCNPIGISIHALREEGDACTALCGDTEIISIHALREEGDATAPRCFPPGCNFYPRPPRGGRPVLTGLFCKHFIFLSTPSARRATPTIRHSPGHGRISIHALREEGDYSPAWNPCCHDIFLSTPSARRATRCARLSRVTSCDFYPRPPRGGRRKP